MGGDMNFNWFNTNKSNPLRTLLNTWGNRQMITTPTTKSDTLIDHIYTNIDPTQTITSTYNTYYSDHDIISMAINKHINNNFKIETKNTLNKKIPVVTEGDSCLVIL